MLDKVCPVYFPFLEVQTSRVDKRLHFASVVDSFAGVSHVAPRSIVRASFVDRRCIGGYVGVAGGQSTARLCSVVAKLSFPFHLMVI